MNIYIGQSVLTYDYRVNKYKESIIVDIRKNVKCCEHTDNEHIHGILIDVDFGNDISKGHFPSSVKEIKSRKAAQMK